MGRSGPGGGGHNKGGTDFRTKLISRDISVSAVKLEIAPRSPLMGAESFRGKSPEILEVCKAKAALMSRKRGISQKCQFLRARRLPIGGKSFPQYLQKTAFDRIFSAQ